MVDPELQKKPTPKATVTEVDFRQVNADFVREMYRVTLLRDVRNEEIGRAMNALDQGGHYEALYNGVVYAEEFREKEKGVAPVGALTAFTAIMAQLSLDQKFDPLKIQAPDESDTGTGAAVGPPQPSEADRTTVKDEIEREAITKSTYWMKQRLGEELLKTIDLKKEYREKLASWYGHFTVALNKRGVDFGLPERNKTDEYFHYKWALDADEDRLKWECINRVERIINAGAGLHEPVPATAPATQTTQPTQPSGQAK